MIYGYKINKILSFYPPPFIWLIRKISKNLNFNLEMKEIIKAQESENNELLSQ